MLRNPAKSRFPFVKSPMPPAKKAVNSTWLLVGKISYFFVLLTTSGSKHPHRCYTYIFPRFEASLSGRGVNVNRNDFLARIYEYRTVCQGFWKNFPSCPIDFPCLFMFWFLPPSFSGGKFGSSNDFHCQTGRNVVYNSRRKNKTKAR